MGGGRMRRRSGTGNGDRSTNMKDKRCVVGSSTQKVAAAAAALMLAVCLGQGAGSSTPPGGGGGYAGSGSGNPTHRPQQPGGYPSHQQQQQPYPQYRGNPGGPGQAPPSPSQGNADGPQPSQGSVPGGPTGPSGFSGYGRGGPTDQAGYRGGPPPQQQQPPMGYGQPTTGQGPGQYGGGGYGGSGGYPGGQGGGYGGRPSYPPQQQPQPAGGDGGPGLFSRWANKLKGGDPHAGPGPTQGYGSGGGRYGGGSPQYPPQGSQPPAWQTPTRPGMALQPTGPSRGPVQSQYPGQDGGFGGASSQHPGSGGRGYQQPMARQPGLPQDSGDDGVGIWSKIKGKVFQGDTTVDEDGPPSFRPGGSVLKKKEENTPNAGANAYGGPGAFGNPYPNFGGPGLGMGMGGGGGATQERSGPGVTEVIAVDKSIVLILKPNELAKKKEKFKQDGVNRLQVIATFDHCLTGFQAKDGKGPCLKTTDVLEQNPHVMLPEAAKKVRYLRSDFKRKMESDGKSMTPEERVAALEDNLRKVYGTVAMEGGVHMNSIGPAIESQLDSVPLREGVDDMTAALAWRAIPLTIFCAGYGNVAMELLKRGSPKIVGPGGLFTPHLRLVANFFRPDDTMTIIGMYDTVPLIHEAKKSGATLLEFLRGVRQESVFASRSNVLLLGSELSDLGLTNGLPSVEERISVGYLKLDEHVMDKLPRYAQAYDVVIIGDGDMSYANEILHEVVG